jgi:hypothetical protein
MRKGQRIAFFEIAVTSAVAALSVDCSRTDTSDRAPSTIERPATLAAPDSLPNIATFDAAPVASADAYRRRAYTRGRAKITVTVGRFEVDDRGYERWVRQSREAYPQADLGLPPELANGFYECSGSEPPACNLLIQLRAGTHIEIRGDGTATRADVDAVAAGLPLRMLAGSGIER